MDDERRRVILTALLKVLGVAVGVGLLIGLVTLVLVKAIGVGDSSPSAGSTSSGDARPSALPTVALGSPSASAGSGSDGSASPAPSTRPAKPKGIKLSANPSSASPGERINLTGRFPGRDNVALQVQRKESGDWTGFAGVQAPVRGGTFATYVLTSRTGANVFRVMDPGSGKASNPVTVNVG